VRTDARKVSPNREVTNERCCRVVMRIRMGGMTSASDLHYDPSGETTSRLVNSALELRNGTSISTS